MLAVLASEGTPVLGWQGRPLAACSRGLLSARLFASARCFSTLRSSGQGPGRLAGPPPRLPFISITPFGLCLQTVPL